jgi:hypothetical protein
MLLKALQEQLSLIWDKTLLQKSLQYIGTDASPIDRVDDVLGCAESVTEILQKIRPETPIITGTWTLNEYFKKNKGYKRVYIPMPGNIIISPTGLGNGTMRGHVGIVGRNNTIMSNVSATGKWASNYDIESWNKRYKDKGGISTIYYSLV